MSAGIQPSRTAPGRFPVRSENLAEVPFATHEFDAHIEGVVLMSRLSRATEPFDVRGKLEVTLSELAPTHCTEPYSCATGAAHFAKDAHEGTSASLGIPTDGRE